VENCPFSSFVLEQWMCGGEITLTEQLWKNYEHSRLISMPVSSRAPRDSNGEFEDSNGEFEDSNGEFFWVF
jgi:hypothetical protein